MEFALVYFNSVTKLVINHRSKLEESYQEILCMIDAWINKRSGWIIEAILSQYINISIYRPLVGSSYIDLPIEIKHSRKGLINIKNKDQKCFLWCHVRHNPSKDHPVEILKIDKRLASNLNYEGIGFPVQDNICINVFGYENGLVFPIYISEQNFEDYMDFLLLIDDDKSHYVYIKDFNIFMFHKTKNKNKKWFYKSCLQCFSKENVLTKHKEDRLSVYGKQSVELEEGIIEFQNYYKQRPVPFKIYADFECNLESVDSYEGFYTKNYHDHVPSSFAHKVVCIDDEFSKPIVVYRGKNPAYEFISVILKEYKHCKKIRNKHFNKNLIMSEEEEYFKKVTVVGFVVSLLIIMMKNLEIIVT